MATPSSPIRLCQTCDGTGTPGGKRRFLNGAIMSRLPDLEGGKRPPECTTCKGDGYVYVSGNQHP